MALDLDEDGWPAHTFADQLIEYLRKSGDNRVKNVVYEGQVASATYPDQRWVWRSAPRLGHAQHIHISFNETAKHGGAAFPLPILDMSRAQPVELVPAKKTAAKKAPAKKAAKPKP
jgi:hypothetical protein